MMPGLIALIVAIVVFWLVLKMVFLVAAIAIGLGAAVIAYFAAEKLIGRSR